MAQPLNLGKCWNVVMFQTIFELTGSDHLISLALLPAGCLPVSLIFVA